MAVAASKSGESMAAPTVSATPFRKSRRVIPRSIPSSRSFQSFAGQSFTGSSEVRLDAGVFGSAVLRFLHRQFRSLEPDATVGAVTERFRHRSAAAAERKRRLAGQVVLVAVGIDQFNRTFGRFHPIGTVLPDSNFDCSHVASGESSRKKIAAFGGSFQLSAISRSS